MKRGRSNLFKIKILVVYVVMFLGIITSVKAQTTIKMEKEGGVFVIPCIVNGLKLKFIFDTGASDVSIGLAEAIFMLKNGYLYKEDILDRMYFSDATGEISVGTRIIIKKIEFAGFTLSNVEASVVHELSAPLLLGQSALSKLGTFQLNPNSGVLTVLSGTDLHSNSNTTDVYTIKSQEYYSKCLTKYNFEWDKTRSCRSRYLVRFQNVCSENLDVKVAVQDKYKGWMSFTKYPLAPGQLISGDACNGTGKYLYWVRKAGDTTTIFPSDNEINLEYK